jgi:Ca2+-binding EF-hand superfamily protein
MTRSEALLGLALLSGIWILGCSKDAPTQPDYGNPALVVEGTEVWEPLQWGWRGQFDRSDADGDQRIDPGEFTAKIRREALAQRALKVFGILDTDGDGQLTWEEYRLKPGEATIVSLDVNGNGTLSSDEFAAAKQSLVKINRFQPLFVTWDRDGDGELTTEELENPPRENGFFDRDADGDLRLSGEELLAKSKSNPRSAERELVYRDRDFDGTLSLREYLYRPRDSKYWAMDTDGDMSVDKKEFSASQYAKQFQAPNEAFDQLDLNPDGRIHVGEFRERVVDVAAVFGIAADSRLGNTKRAFEILDRNSDEILVADEVLPNDSTSTDSMWEELFHKTDSDSDKKLTLEEFGKRASAYNFLVVDDDRDGRVSETELHIGTMPWMSPKRCREFFTLADVDEDGMLNVDEFRNRSERTEFLDCDTDEDSHVSLEEFGQRKGHLMYNGRLRPSFAAHDLDGSGDLSRDEFEHAPKIVEFLERDLNDDNFLTLEELTSGITSKSSLNWRTKIHGQKDKDSDRRLSYREFLDDRDLALFWEMDEDGNNVVSPTEFKKSDRFSRLAAVADAFFRSLDQNRNGELEVQEYERRSDGAIMTELDQDGDSSLTVKEFAHSGYSNPRLAHKAFELSDEDADGKLTLEEFQKRPDEESLKPPADAPSEVEAAFAFLDVDKDRKVVSDEFAIYAQKAQMGSAAGRVFDNVDRNDDAGLTLDEFKKRQEPLRFLLLDQNKDGALTPLEYWGYVSWATSDRNENLLAVIDSDHSGDLQYPEFNRQWSVARLLLEDKDENGAIEFDEYRNVRASKMEANAISREFDAFDCDGSKTLSAEELAHSPFTKSFLDKDVNGDGFVAAEEFLANAKSPKEQENRTREFSRLDKNEDQQVNLHEYFFGPANAKFWSMDTNGNMLVDAEEFTTSKLAQALSNPGAAFKALDRNGDGTFCIAEYHERSNDVAPVFGLKTRPWPSDVNLMFARLDRDDDGTVVAAEAIKKGVESTVEFEESLAAMDKDGDGTVTLAEFKKRTAPFHFPVWDTDQNGTLSPEELRTSEISWATDQQIQKIFKAIDSDGNGTISVDEFRARKKQAPMLLADWDEDGNLSYDEFSRQNGRYHERGQMKLVFETFDRDGNGQLSRDEFTEKPAAMGFIDRDTNGDSLVDKKEFSAAAKSTKDKAAREKDFAKKDSDANGKLTQNEFFGAATDK